MHRRWTESGGFINWSYFKFNNTLNPISYRSRLRLQFKTNSFTRKMSKCVSVSRRCPFIKKRWRLRSVLSPELCCTCFCRYSWAAAQCRSNNPSHSRTSWRWRWSSWCPARPASARTGSRQSRCPWRQSGSRVGSVGRKGWPGRRRLQWCCRKCPTQSFLRECGWRSALCCHGCRTLYQPRVQETMKDTNESKF